MNNYKNLPAVEWEKRYLSLSEDKRKALDDLEKALSFRSDKYDFFQLRYIKNQIKSRRKGICSFFHPGTGSSPADVL